MKNTFAGMKPVEKSTTLAAKVSAQIRTAIMSGSFKPGEQLTHRSVAETLKVSLTPAREALFTLVSEGTLDAGAYGTIFIPTMNYDRIRELAKIRTLLEGLLAEEAANKLSDAAIGELTAIHERLSDANASSDFRKVVRLNWEFHFGIYEGAEMPIALKIIEGCWLKTTSYYSNVYPEILKNGEGIKNHAAIVDALQTRNPSHLARAIQRDVEFGSKVLLSAIRGS